VLSLSNFSKEDFGETNVNKEGNEKKGDSAKVAFSFL